MQYVPWYCKQESKIHKCTLKSNNSQPFHIAVDCVFPDNIPLLRTSNLLYVAAWIGGKYFSNDKACECCVNGPMSGALC